MLCLTLFISSHCYPDSHTDPKRKKQSKSIKPKKRFMITTSSTYFLKEDLFGENAKVLIFGIFSLSEPVKLEYLRQLFDLDF